MSIVFHGFSAKDKIHFAKQVRYIRKCAKELIASQGIDVQWFETSQGIVFRILEAGYGIKNKLWHNPKYFPDVSYDDRSDMPDEMYSNLDIVNEIDKLIAEEKYRIITIKEGN